MRIPALTVLLCVERVDRLPNRLDVGAGADRWRRNDRFSGYGAHGMRALMFQWMRLS